MDVVIGQHRVSGYPICIATLTDIGIALGAFTLATLVGLALGAANFGTALGIGQVIFVFVVTAIVLLRN
jgi:hypothetical protein